MTFDLSPKSKSFLPALHPDLVKVIKEVVLTTPVPFIIHQGLRTAQEEYNLWASCHNIDGSRIPETEWKTNCNGYPVGTRAPSGAWGTGVSRHQSGHAIDFAALVNGNVVWYPLDLYHHIADAFIAAGAKLNIPVVYGGTWPAPKTDSDHIELNEAFYPVS